MQAMGLQSLLYETTVDYINVYHNVSFSLRRILRITKLLTLFSKTLGSQLRFLPNLEIFCNLFSILTVMLSTPQ